ncbi:efflux RND transporter periplasmic adaptor subunit [Flavitalea sp. BT771]|uniref:efflux RND transporter periplasmic adaptor subunit n=1 Tax=Flavitalea sp. BT771 TaxID=3063329 RepID=UPI0026E2CB8B|nr:efflux RND transporter periplasmic adaptor subunit [Flavitalea sp. BT771]MDO6430359.1 efflux RND transporter periplasmic adaptor subunit [Flavitalea sp. BT771]MDV6219501.1 efflux RND transporter periplasmic adaptor subunit [Flavitalea sp. BT771]
MKYTEALFSSVIFPGLFLLAGCSGGRQPEAGENKDKPVAVTIGTPSGKTTDGVRASGQVEAVQTAAVSTRVMGTITRIYVKVGDKVNKGQLLVSISGEDLAAKRAQADAQIAGARADAENARKDLDRFTTLFSRQSATASELDNATLRYTAAKSRLDAAVQMRNEVDASMAYTRLTAPFAGMITQKLADEGSLASPGMPLLILEQSKVLQVSASVAESDISRIRTGDKAEVEIKSTGGKATGLITQVSTSSAATGGQFLVKISLPAEAQKGLYAGMYVNIFIPVTGMAPVMTGANRRTGDDAILVPLSALVQNDQLTGVYTVSSAHTALLRWVRTGKTVGDKIEILSGLGPDEPFIVSAAGKLYNGAPVLEK